MLQYYKMLHMYTTCGRYIITIYTVGLESVLTIIKRWGWVKMADTLTDNIIEFNLLYAYCHFDFIV